MTKNTRCDYCEEIIEHYGIVLNVDGRKYNFCEGECLNAFIADNSRFEDVEEGYDN